MRKYQDAVMGALYEDNRKKKETKLRGSAEPKPQAASHSLLGELRPRLPPITRDSILQGEYVIT